MGRDVVLLITPHYDATVKRGQQLTKLASYLVISYSFDNR